MKRLHFTLVILLLLYGVQASAQDFPVPDNYVLKTADDYAKYEPDVIKTIDWLQQTPWTEDPGKRRVANTFLIAWDTGSPNVSISIGNGIGKMIDKNKDLLIAFMGAYTKYALQHKTDFDKDAATVYSLRAVIEKYNKEPTRVEDSALEKVIKIDKKGKLEEWVKTDFNK